MAKNKPTYRNPWAWVPSLYYAEGIPYIVVMTVAVIMYKRLGISNTEIALYTSWLYLPWVIKPLWSPLVDILKTKRFWIVIMQLFVGAGLAGVALTIHAPNFFQYTLAFLFLLAFSSATHDIAADGFYMLGLSKHDQAFYVGVRSSFYRLAMITGQGLLVILAGYFESTTGLQSVDITVSSSNKTEIVQVIEPASINIQALEGELRLVPESTNKTIVLQSISSAKVDSLINLAKNWNTANGFYQLDKEKVAAKTENQHNSLETIIVDWFGEEKIKKKQTEINGNLGLVYFALSNTPESGEDVVVNFSWSSGSKDISLIEGTRLVFNENNWTKPALAIIQLDPKLNRNESAVFTARAGNIPLSWVITFVVLSILFLLFFIYHKFMLPYPVIDKKKVLKEGETIFSEFINTFVLFFKRKNIGIIIAFLLLYRFAEAQLSKLASPFLLDAREVGGLGLTTGELGLVYGTVGLVALTLGGLLGGFLAAKHGLKHWLWYMVIAINLPNAVYIFLSYVMPDTLLIINICVAIEQFGYGFGFTAYMLYMIYVSDGEHKTAHFAITTGFMAFGMMIPGAISGWLQELIGYQHFFIWVMVATIPAFIVTRFIPLDANFGKKKEGNSD